jgi:signal transduction histidine kinase
LQVTENRKTPLRPISILHIILITAISLLTADFFEFYLHRSADSTLPTYLVFHWSSETIALLLVFGLLYQPLRARIRQRQELDRALLVSEEQYRTLVEGLDAGVALIDDNYQLVKANQAMEKFIGPPACHYSPRKCYELLIFSGGGVCQNCPAAETLATGLPASAEMHLPDATNGEIRDIRVSTFPVADSQGDVKQFIEVVDDITDEKKAAIEIQRLSRELTSAAEAERKRLARDLHDQCGQILAGVQYTLEALRAEVAVELPEMASHFDIISTLMEQIGDNIRQVSTRLHPSVLDDLGLIPTLSWLVEGFRNQRPDIHVKFTAGDVSESLVPELETTIYRICQESLNNVFKHSRASQVEVRFVAGPDAAVLCIEDNGCGFQVEETMIHAALAGNVGLRGMRERAQVLGGSLTVKSEPGHGTLVEARIPYTLEN